MLASTVDREMANANAKVIEVVVDNLVDDATPQGYAPVADQRPTELPKAYKSKRLA